LPPALAHGFGPVGAFDLAVGANASGDVTLTFVLDRRLPAPLMTASEELGTFVNPETRAAAALPAPPMRDGNPRLIAKRHSKELS
jgi:hypothetical protein